MKSHNVSKVTVACNLQESQFVLRVNHLGVPTHEDDVEKMLHQHGLILAAQEQELKNCRDHKKFLTSFHRISFFKDQIEELYVKDKSIFNPTQLAAVIQLVLKTRKQLKNILKNLEQSKINARHQQGLKEYISAEQINLNSVLILALISAKKFYEAESYFSETYDLTYTTPYNTVEETQLTRASLILCLAEIAKQRNDFLNLEAYLRKAHKLLNKANVKGDLLFHELALHLAQHYRQNNDHRKVYEWYRHAIEHTTKKNLEYISYMKQAMDAIKASAAELNTVVHCQGFKLEIKGIQAKVVITDSSFHLPSSNSWQWQLTTSDMEDIKHALKKLRKCYEAHRAHQIDLETLKTNETIQSIKVVSSSETTSSFIKPGKMEALDSELEGTKEQSTFSTFQNLKPDSKEVKNREKKPKPATKSLQQTDNSLSHKVAATSQPLPEAEQIFGEIAKCKKTYELKSKYSSARFFGYYNREAINAKSNSMTHDEHDQFEAELAKESINNTVRYVKGKEEPTFKIAPHSDKRVWSDVVAIGKDNHGKKCFFLEFGTLHDHPSQVKEYRKKVR